MMQTLAGIAFYFQYSSFLGTASTHLKVDNKSSDVCERLEMIPGLNWIKSTTMTPSVFTLLELSNLFLHGAVVI